MNSIELNKIWIAIPTYNNQGSVKKVVENCLDVLQNVIVVDDGSNDCDLEKELHGLPVRILKHPKNLGKGKAIITAGGFVESMGGKYMITIDADGQHNPKDCNFFFPLLKETADNIVIGTRDFEVPNIPESSRFGRRLSNFWVKIETGIAIPDTQSGFRAYPVGCLNKLNYTHKSYDFEIEALVKLIWSGIHVENVSISVLYEPSGKRITHFRPFLDNIRLSWLHSKLVLRRLLPFPHKRLFPKKPAAPLSYKFKNPFKLIQLILADNVNPAGLGAAAFVGVSIGVLPILSFHSIAITYVSHRLHLNIPVALTIQNFCAPPFVPAMCILLGHYFLTGTLFRDFTIHGLVAWGRLYEWFLGSLILSPVFGFSAFFAVYFIAVFVKKMANSKGKKNG